MFAGGAPAQNMTPAAVFFGAPVTAIAASDLAAVVIRNGTAQDATVIVIGEGIVTSL
jgi:hypothetical protein